MFVAQAAGVELSLGQQLGMMLTHMLTSKGVAAVPRASLVILSGTLAAFNLPLAGITIVLAVDELMDMARTSVNLVGNCLATAVMARWEGELNIPEHTMPAEALLAVGPSSPEDAEARADIAAMWGARRRGPAQSRRPAQNPPPQRPSRRTRCALCCG